MDVHDAVITLARAYGCQPWYRTAGVVSGGRELPGIVLWHDPSWPLPGELRSGFWMGHSLEVLAVAKSRP